MANEFTHHLFHKSAKSRYLLSDSRLWVRKLAKKLVIPFLGWMLEVYKAGEPMAPRELVVRILGKLV